MHLVDGRREVGGVVHQFGEQVHDAFGGEAGDGDVRRAVQPDPLIGGDPADRAPQDALHDDRPVPGTAGPAAHQQGQPVRHQAELRGAVVQLQQIAEHLFAVTFLHAAQIGEHADGLRLDAAERLGGRGLRGEGAALAERELPEHRLDGGAQQRLFREVHLGLHGGAGLAFTEPGGHARQRLAGEAFHLGGQGVQFVAEPGVLPPQLVVDPRALGAQSGGLLLLPLDGGREDVQQLALTRPARQRDPPEGVGCRYSAAYETEQRGQRHVGGVDGVRFECGQRGLEPFGLGGPGRGRALGAPGEGVRDAEGDGQDDPAGDHHRHRPAARPGRSQDHGHGSGDGEYGQHGHKRRCRRPGCFHRLAPLTGWYGFWHGCGPSVLPSRRCAAAPRRCSSPGESEKAEAAFPVRVDHIVDMLVRRLIR
ncbi:hypothetical protein P376_3571 [Streptomyces sp. HCCB10043]|nr:hypothetical protein P376_3571 [Streptomyces sp. HCCB10043]